MSLDKHPSRHRRITITLLYSVLGELGIEEYKSCGLHYSLQTREVLVDGCLMEWYFGCYNLDQQMFQWDRHGFALCGGENLTERPWLFMLQLHIPRSIDGGWLCLNI